jgi:hypothetical protein
MNNVQKLNVLQFLVEKQETIPGSEIETIH